MDGVGPLPFHKKEIDNFLSNFENLNLQKFKQLGGWGMSQAASKKSVLLLLKKLVFAGWNKHAVEASKKSNIFLKLTKCAFDLYFNPLSAKFIKWSNKLKQIVGKLPTICLSVFDHFSGLAFKGLMMNIPLKNKRLSLHF